ncbi:hypothetical protein B0H11DRAFT_2198970 [Mycena galericulata]|nr:hypothetical protein B0H11DRAFT_2198970 [Mycena galericulata]
MICMWPVPFPPQDDGAILWAFIRQFMSWRDGVRHMPETGQPVTAEGRVNCLVRQMKNIISLEQVLGEWKEETLKACVDHNSTPNTEPGGSLGAAIQANTTKRLLREAMMVSLLGSLVTAWRNHISGVPLTGPGLYSDVGLMRRCLSITEEHQTFGEILEAHDGYAPHNPAFSLQRVIQDHESPRLNNALVVFGQQPPQGRDAQSAAPAFAHTRRGQIQQEWNKIASEAGAAEIQFINDVDDEDVPPGIGILFVYLERSYLQELGIPKPTSPIGCHCKKWTHCIGTAKCSCQAGLEDAPPYTAQGIFTFNTESEIIECNRFCACSDNCVNRVAQIPRKIAIQIFKTENKRGWGARAPISLSAGQVLGLYTGLLMRRDEANKLTGSRASYCFDLDVNEEPDEDPPTNSYSVDAFGCGNWTRFLNHSCSPNLKIISVVYESSPEDNMPYLALVATEAIPAYKELTFDYNPSHQAEYERRRYREKTALKKNKAKTQARCLCGAQNCRGWLSVVP